MCFLSHGALSLLPSWPELHSVCSPLFSCIDRRQLIVSEVSLVCVFDVGAQVKVVVGVGVALMDELTERESEK